MTLDPKCPGPERSPDPRPETFPCPDCGGEIEMWTDEKKAKCPDCGVSFPREVLSQQGEAKSK